MILFRTAVFCIFLTFQLFYNQCFSQETGSLSGIITTVSKNSISDTKVSFNFKEVKTGTMLNYDIETNENGEFKIKNIPYGKYNVACRIEGYKDFKKYDLEINSENTKLDFNITSDGYTTAEIDIVAERFRQAQNDMRTSLLNLSPKTTKVIPGVGEDVLRSLQTLPGVSSPNDFSSQLIVRGSGPDQNLIIMDDVEIFNPYRLYGVFSMFNPETLDDINLITGAFPSKYGDRLSAVLDVTNKEGNRKKSISGLTNINIGNANLVFGGKLPIKTPGSWLVSSRRTYYDLILGPFAKKAGLIDDDASFPSFEDIQSKVTFGPYKYSKFTLNAIFSKDGVNIIPGKSNKLEDSVTVKDITKNDVLSTAWHYAPSSRFLSRTTLSWYRNSGDANFGGQLLDPVLDRESYTPEVRDSLRALGLFLGINFSSKYFFRKYSVSNTIVISDSINRAEFGGGIDVLKTDLEFHVMIDDRLKSMIQNNPNFNALQDAFIEGKNYWRANLYAQDRLKITKKLYVQTGVRFDYFDIISKPYLSPRINISYAIDPLTTLRLGTGLYYQSPGYEKLIDGGVFYDLTPEKAKNLEAEKSEHLIAGIERWISHDVLLKVEGYYKRFNDLVVQEKLTGYRYEFYLNDPNNHDPAYMRDPANWTRSSSKVRYDSLTSNPVNGANGKAYGVEIFLEKKNIDKDNKLSGWISYSFSRTQRERGGLITPFRYDQRHSLNIVANYRILKWLELGAHFNFSSNFPYTPPLGIKPRVVNDSLAVLPVVHQVQFDYNFGGEENLLSAKKPDYHRLDLRATAYTHFWNADWAFYVDIINVYNRKNVVGYDYYIDGNLNVQKKTIGQFPLLPTIGVNVRF